MRQLFACILVLITLGSVFSYSGLDNLRVCLSNCRQCKIMYGQFFQGELCAEDCMSNDGASVPDCAQKNSIFKYIVRAKLKKAVNARQREAKNYFYNRL